VWKTGKIEKQHDTRRNDEDKDTGPTLKKTIKITPDSVTGAPLKLRFEDIFLRKPKKKRGEADYVITEQDRREDYYNHIWPPTPEVGSQDESCKSALLTSHVNCSQS